MKITYASHHVWYKFIEKDPLAQFGRNAAAKLRSTLKQLPLAVTVSEQEVDEELLSWFIPLYEHTLQKKHNPNIIDIADMVHASKGTAKKYFALVLRQNQKPLGATLFTLRENKLSLAYRAYEYAWHSMHLPASPALFMELQICLHAQHLGKHILTHGRDQNPYGLHSNIGLAAFKLSAGCKVRTARTCEVLELDTDTLTEDVFVLSYPGVEKRRISTGYLIAKKENIDRFMQLTRYPHLLSVKVVER